MHEQLTHKPAQALNQDVAHAVSPSGSLTHGVAVSYTGNSKHVHYIDHHPRLGLLVSDDRGSVAEREGRGPGGSFWRYGIADGVWAAGIGNAAFQSNHGFRHRVHVYVAGAIDCRHAQRRHERDNPRKEGTGQAVCAWGQPAGARTSADDGDSVDAGRAKRSAAAVAGSTEEVVTHAEVAELADALA